MQPDALRYNDRMQWGESIRSWLPAGGFGQELYVYASVDSTNTTAAHLAELGAMEGTLVVADHQRRGRGRGGSRWETPAGSAIAMSLVLRPAIENPLRWVGLGALAAAEALERDGLAPQIKWPNDVLLGGRKVAGVLAEAVWEGDRVRYLVLGIGLNVSSGSLPAEADFPATTVEEESARAVDRSRLVAGIVASLGGWYAALGSDEFLRAWQNRLAYLGKRVRVDRVGGSIEGSLVGLGPGGEARLLDDEGRETLCAGEARSLRLAPSGD
jgi:BirA family biotin operon repressor/biotin-[acetyl-CoA-carboxylase] ligase